jgi:hypothetical protein
MFNRNKPVVFGKKLPHSDIKREIGRLTARREVCDMNTSLGRASRLVIDQRLAELHGKLAAANDTRNEQAWNRASRHALAIVVGLGVGGMIAVFSSSATPDGRIKITRSNAP